MEIRKGKMEDSPAIKAIDSSIDSDSFRKQLIDRSLQQGTLRVAVDNGEVVGYSIVNYSFFQRPTLEMLIVAKARRGEGFGRTLLQEAQTGHNEFWTSTNESNIRMQSLLNSEGFERSGRIENLDPGDPELIYFKKLCKP